MAVSLQVECPLGGMCSEGHSPSGISSHTRRPGATMRRVSDKSQLRRSSRKTRPVHFKSAKVAKDKESLSEKLLGPGRAQREVMCCGPWDWKGMLGEDWGWESTDFGESWCISAGLGG